MKEHKRSFRVITLLLVAAMMMGSSLIVSQAATFDDINANGVFYHQESSVTCTLASAVMMLRRYAILRGDSNWQSITESSVKKVAWGNGLKWSFTYSAPGGNISVSHDDLPTGSANKDKMISLLSDHAEGIVIYHTSNPTHAVLLTDYSDGEFYCADPGHSSFAGRRVLLNDVMDGWTNPSEGKNMTLEGFSAYWYISSPKLSLASAISASDTFIFGDIDLDGYITPRDARTALRFAAKFERYNDDQLSAGDMDNNGTIDAVDARIILRMAAELDDNSVTTPATAPRSTVCAYSDKDEVGIGEEFTVTVEVIDAVGLECGAAWLSFDPSLVELLNTDYGVSRATVSISEMDDEIALANAEGRIHNAFAYTKSELNESVTIYSATFKAIAPGSAEFGFIGEKLYGLSEGVISFVQISDGDSGTCGENLTWTLDSDGLLTISGTGEMTDYSLLGDGRSPFCENEDIVKVIIKDGVISIGSAAFLGCTGLTSVTIPRSVTSIGEAAFYDTGLTDVLYSGSEEEWNTISVGFTNNDLRNAEIYYNHGFPHDFTVLVESKAPTC